MASAELELSIRQQMQAMGDAEGWSQDEIEETFGYVMGVVEDAEAGDAESIAWLQSNGIHLTTVPTTAGPTAQGGLAEAARRLNQPFDVGGVLGGIGGGIGSALGGIGSAVGGLFGGGQQAPAAAQPVSYPVDAIPAPEYGEGWYWAKNPWGGKNLINPWGTYSKNAAGQDVYSPKIVLSSPTGTTAKLTPAQEIAQMEEAIGSLTAAEKRRVALGFAPAGAEGMAEYRRITAQQAQQRLDLDRFGKTLEAARTANPLTYLAMIRGAVPGQGPTGELYEGLKPVIPTLAPPSNEVKGRSEGIGAVGGGVPGLPSTPGGLPNVGGQPWSPQMAASGAPPDLVALVQKYFPPDQWDNALAVAQGESGWNPNAWNQSGENSQGYFQINRAAHPNAGNMFDPEANVAYAAQLYKQQGWQPWTVARNMGLTGQAGRTTTNAPWAPPPMPSFMTKTQAGQPLGAYTIPAGVMRPPGVQQQAEMSPYEKGTMEEAVQYQGMPLMDWRDYQRRLRSAVGMGIAPARSYGGSLR